MCLCVNVSVTYDDMRWQCRDGQLLRVMNRLLVVDYAQQPSVRKKGGCEPGRTITSAVSTEVLLVQLM
jgi:hypothetical protein